ncbi:MAG: Co2+/Mg2+ efflux protein ApaG [Planctomycetota bacterium]|nr:Co2+/Mg2+ efflux protein ApaG [Planctomycetota bacterium]
MGSDQLTRGIRVRVVPEYLPAASLPDDRLFYFDYYVTISNEGKHKVKLLSRHWVIINSEGERREVRGPGVVGETPSLLPGETFEYKSSCHLDTHWGTMEGTYRMKGMEGEEDKLFDVEIGRFFLVADVPEPAV